MAEEPHPEAQAVIDQADARIFPDSHALSPASARERIEDLFARSPVEDVDTVETFAIDGPAAPIPVRLYEPAVEPPYPLLLYFHGGGFVAGSLDSHDDVCAALTNRADCLTVSVDYRLAPEHPFPAAVEDCYAALEWAADHAGEVLADADRIAVAGDSAGGNLAAVVSLLARDTGGPDIAHQALVYPVLGSPLVHDFDSYEANGEGYLLERATSEWYLDQYVPGDVHRRNAYFSPLLAGDHGSLPPATVVTAGFDLHRDEGIAYAEALAEAGVDVDLRNYEEMIHSFVSLSHVIERGEDAIEAIAANLRADF